MNTQAIYRLFAYVCATGAAISSLYDQSFICAFLLICTMFCSLESLRGPNGKE